MLLRLYEGAECYSMFTQKDRDPNWPPKVYYFYLNLILLILPQNVETQATGKSYSTIVPFRCFSQYMFGIALNCVVAELKKTGEVSVSFWMVRNTFCNLADLVSDGEELATQAV